MDDERRGQSDQRDWNHAFLRRILSVLEGHPDTAMAYEISEVTLVENDFRLVWWAWTRESVSPISVGRADNLRELRSSFVPNDPTRVADAWMIDVLYPMPYPHHRAADEAGIWWSGQAPPVAARYEFDH